ncbi:hypothetical protein ETAA8_01680 [Anatilimnocola aggregata]|uniref:Uncharacterized protein n=1 Tax=Anatilimnocola aggregata TaxID=2528021 RepID=A0A517Y4G4_9BACT|nr:DUF1444 family protein [Anatilimnocola aggregata]QDU25107.1 hypothetical protein ETAA8_01680 [Anatilimnocola aggregata]
MGWFDYFFRPPSKDKFARLMLAEIAKSKLEGPLTYDAGQFLLLRKDGGFINLANVYQEYCQVSRGERAAIMQRFIRGSLASKTFELPEDFEDVHPDLLPVIRSRFQIEAVRLQARLKGSDKVNIPQQLIGDHLALSLVYDLPHAMRSIGQQDLDDWNVTFYEAVEAARHNLEQMNNISVASLDDRVFATATGDNYDASRLLLVDVIRTFPVRGLPVAIVPNRDTLLVAGQDDHEGLQLLATLAEEAYQKPRPISGVMLTLVDDEWQSWLPEPSSPAYNRLHELKLRSIGGEYNDQKDLLEQLHSARGEDVFVSSFSGVQDSQTGNTSSYCIWPRDVPTLLPETEQVYFMGGDPKQPQLLAQAPWDRVQQVVGHLLQAQDCYPPRYLVSDFPSEKELSKLGKTS